MVLSHVGEHKGDLLCCMPIEGAVETAAAFHTLNFPLKSYFFLHGAPPLTVHPAAAILHPKDVQRYHSGVTLKPSPASLILLIHGLLMSPRLKAPRAGAPSPTQQCFPHSAPGKYPPPFTHWFLAGAILGVSTALTDADCAMEGPWAAPSQPLSRVNPARDPSCLGDSCSPSSVQEHHETVKGNSQFRANWALD